MILARKLEEARISAQEGNEILQVGSYAGVPGEPAGLLPVEVSLVAGLIGGMLGLGCVFAWSWWEEGDKEGEEQQRDRELE